MTWEKFCQSHFCMKNIKSIMLKPIAKEFCRCLALLAMVMLQSYVCHMMRVGCLRNWLTLLEAMMHAANWLVYWGAYINMTLLAGQHCSSVGSQNLVHLSLTSKQWSNTHTVYIHSQTKNDAESEFQVLNSYLFLICSWLTFSCTQWNWIRIRSHFGWYSSPCWYSIWKGWNGTQRMSSLPSPPLPPPWLLMTRKKKRSLLLSYQLPYCTQRTFINFPLADHLGLIWPLVGLVSSSSMIPLSFSFDVRRCCQGVKLGSLCFVI